MKVYAKGKNIPTYSFSGLFVQGEKLADTIVFYVDRFYNDNDLSDCTFMIRGVSENGDEAQQTLIAQTEESQIVLTWNVSEYFTAQAGKLSLELRASRMSEGSQSATAEEILVLKYTMEPVYVAASPKGGNLPVPDAVEQAIGQISDAVTGGLTVINQVVESNSIAAFNTRLDKVEADTDVYLARPEVIPVTQQEYSAITPKADALYVII